MSDVLSRLDAIDQRLKAATPGPWYSHECSITRECWCKVVGTTDNRAHEDMDKIVSAGSVQVVDAELIANAPADLTFTVQALREALAALDKCKAKIGEDVYVIATRADVIATETLDRIARLAGE